MRKTEGVRVSESRLTSRLSVVYRYGYALVLGLMLLGFIFTSAGWDISGIILKIGVVMLLCIPVVSTIWVGYEALTGRDRRLLSIVAGIILLLLLAGLLSALQ